MARNFVYLRFLKFMRFIVQIINFFFGDEHHRHHHNKRKTKLVVSGISNNFITIKTKQLMSLSLTELDFVNSTLSLVDHKTQTVISDAVFSNQAYTSDNEAVATVDSAGKVTAVAAGSANITFKSDVTYTDKNGNPKTEAGKVAVVAVTVTEAPQTTDLVVSFSAPNT